VKITDHGLVETREGPVWRTHVGAELPDGKILDHNIDVDKAVADSGADRKKIELSIGFGDLYNLLMKNEYYKAAGELTKLAKEWTSSQPTPPAPPPAG
jgi:hypothetical protein